MLQRRKSDSNPGQSSLGYVDAAAQFATENTVGLAVPAKLEKFRILEVPLDTTLAAKDTKAQGNVSSTASQVMGLSVRKRR
jgi:hypothetical protein